MSSEDREIPSRMAFIMADREIIRQRGVHFYAMFRGVLRSAEELCCNGRAPEYGPPDSNFIHGDESYLEMVWVKVSRLINIVESKRNALAEGGWDAWNKFDRGRLADSLVDLVNYSAFWAADICLAGAWPANVQAQPQPVYATAHVPQPKPAPAQPDEACDTKAWFRPLTDEELTDQAAKVMAEMLEFEEDEPEEEEEEEEEDGVEQIQCPRCRSNRGFFGRLDGAWVTGCRACGVQRKSHQVGSIIAWIVETLGSRSFRSARYGEQGDLTHVVKTAEFRAARQAVGAFRDEGSETTSAEHDSEEGQPTDEELLSHALKLADEPTWRHEEAERGIEPDRRRSPLVFTPPDLPQTFPPVEETPASPASANMTLPMITRKKRKSEEVSGEEPEPRPDQRPAVSNTTAFTQIDCCCGNQADVFVVASTDKKNNCNKVALRLRCVTCQIDKKFADMRAVSRFIEAARIKKTIKVDASELTGEVGAEC